MSGRVVRHRTTGRVLPVNGAGEVLLLHGWDPAAPDVKYWFSIGGGADHDEPLSDEVAELNWGFLHLVQDQTFYATRLDDTGGLHLDGLEPLERGTIDQAAWWTADALDADGSAANDNLTTMMRAAVRQILGEA